MAFLGEVEERDLRVVCEEMGEVAPPNAGAGELRDIILNSYRYEEEMVENLVSAVIEQREEDEEREREEKEREEEDREYRERIEREDREYRERIEREDREYRERREREDREDRERERERQTEIRELEEKLRRRKERNREEVPARESGDGSNGTGRDLTRYWMIMLKVVEKTPDRAEEWPFYFRHAEMMFERYAVPEQYRGDIIEGLLIKGRVKGLYLTYGREGSNYEATKHGVLREYGATDTQRRRKFNSGDRRWAGQQQKEWEEAMELKWGLGKRMQDQKCKLVEENNEAFRGGKIRAVEVGGRQSAGVCPKPEGSREEVPPRSQMQEVKREQASSDYSSVAYGAVGGAS